MSLRNLADIEAIEAEPLSRRSLPPNTYAALLASAKRTPDAKALSFFLTAEDYKRAHSWTYAELIAEVTRAANVFHSFGVTPEHPVAFVLPNLPETHFTVWGGEAAGVVLAINPLLEPSQIAQLLQAARARVLVTLAPAPGPNDLWSRLSKELTDLPDLQIVLWVDLASYVDDGTREAIREFAQKIRSTALAFEIVDFQTAMRDQPSDHLIAPRRIGPQDTSSYFCTGGTTGLPKIAVRTHGGEVFDAWAVAQVLGSQDSQRTFFCGLPLFHANAQLVTGLLPWMCGDHVVIGTPEGYRGKGVLAQFWEIMSHYRASMFSGVPTIFAALLDAPIGDTDISSLQFAICGAAPMPAKLIETFEAKTGVKILEGYGLTEGTCVSSVNPPDGARIAGSIGLRLPHQQMRAVILNENGRFVRMAGVGEVGVIAIHGPNVFSGYLDARHNEGVWIEIGDELWLNTGDLGRQDANGYFWLSGRKKELIIRGGHNIDPKVIEEALSKHPAVALAAAVGRPDPLTGEIPVAYVQTKPDALVSEDELLEFAARNIPERAAIPKKVRISSTLPMTAVGKIFKPALQQLEVESVVYSEAARVGATIAEMKVSLDTRLGLLAVVHVNGDSRLLDDALGKYAFKSHIRGSAG
jgi:fatty-acyl-CoA synthase